MERPAWQRMADVERRATVEQVFSLARREARESVLDREEVHSTTTFRRMEFAFLQAHE